MSHSARIRMPWPSSAQLTAISPSLVVRLPRVLHGLRRRALAAAAGQPPDTVGLLPLPNADAVVLGEVVRASSASPCFARYAGRRTQQPPVRRDAPRDHARVRRRAEADADIERVLRQRRRIDRQLQLHFDLRILAHEARDQRRHVAAPEAERRVDAQQALWRGLRRRRATRPFRRSRPGCGGRCSRYSSPSGVRLMRRVVRLTSGDAQPRSPSAPDACSRPAS